MCLQPAPAASACLHTAALSCFVARPQQARSAIGSLIWRGTLPPGLSPPHLDLHPPQAHRQQADWRPTGLCWLRRGRQADRGRQVSCVWAALSATPACIPGCQSTPSTFPPGALCAPLPPACISPSPPSLYSAPYADRPLPAPPAGASPSVWCCLTRSRRRTPTCSTCCCRSSRTAASRVGGRQEAACFLDS